jgi:sulfite reductase (NADPH) hemoprotein beta-component
MYRYDELDQTFIRQRVAQFRDQVHRRLTGSLTEDEFKPLRLLNGLYLQLHAYMLRVAIPYGMLSAPQLRALAQVARKYDRGYGHFTTRQNIQFNWIKLDEAPDALADLAEAGIHAIQTSGNTIRNTTTDELAGVAPDEIEDPRPWCELIRQWSTLHPEFSFLPRKFKIAVTGSPHDRAAVRVHDIGLRMHRNDEGEVGFEVLVGGGLGRTPMIGKTVKNFLPKRRLLSYLEAILRVYNLAGRRDNLYKSRIKILVHDVGAARMAELVEAEWAPIRDGALAVADDDIARLAAQFAPPPYVARAPRSEAVERLVLTDPAFARWRKANLFAHKVPGYAAVKLSLKPVDAPPGDVTAAQLDAIAELSERYGFGEVRVAHEQNLVLPDVALDDLPALWRALDLLGLATANIGLLSDIIACPGLDFCGLANARSIPVAERLTRRFADIKRVHDVGELHINISGCINACGHHHVGHIGLLGVDKNGEEHYQITLGGRADEHAALGKLLGPAVPYDGVVDAVERIVETYVALRQDGEIFIDTVGRVGTAPFKEAVYVAA